MRSGRQPGQGECARPDYPASAARAGESGTVSLALLIGANGKVADADDLTGATIGDELKINERTMGRYEREEYEPCAMRMVQIADLYGVTTDSLYGRARAA